MGPAYNDNYYIDLSMVLYKVISDNHVGCLSIEQVQTSMLLWIFGHRRYNRKVCTICKRLEIAKDYWRIVWTFLSK